MRTKFGEFFSLSKTKPKTLLENLFKCKASHIKFQIKLNTKEKRRLNYVFEY